MNLPDWILNNHQTILLVFVVSILVYLGYVIWKSSGNTTKMIEAFSTTPQELSDLLDKIKVGVYDNESVWNNKFYNYQAKYKTDKPLSFWLPLLTSATNLPSGLKILGTCVSENTLYNSPTDTTMLVKGDVKAPNGANEVFMFPHNQLTKPQLDSKGNPVSRYVLKGIKEMSQVDIRIRELVNYLTELKGTYENIKIDINEIKNQVVANTKFDVIGYDPESYFKSANYTVKIQPGQTIKLPVGEYQSLRVPVGCSGTLEFDKGHTETFSYPYKGVLDPNDPTKYKGDSSNPANPDAKLTYKDVNERGADIQRWMITGNYGLGFRRGNIGYIFHTGRSKFGSETFSYSTSLNYGVGDMGSEGNTPGLYEHGKADLVDYFAKFYSDDYPEFKQKEVLPTPDISSSRTGDVANTNAVYQGSTKVYLGQVDPSWSSKYPNNYFILDKPFSIIRTWGKRFRQDDASGGCDAKFAKNVKVIESPHLIELTTKIEGLKEIADALNTINTRKTAFMTENNWYAPRTTGLAEIQKDDIDNGFKVKQLYMDMAFRMHTMRKSARSDGTYCPFGKPSASQCSTASGSKCNCCDIDNDKWVSLIGGGDKYLGPLKTATIKFDTPATQLPYYKKYLSLYSNITLYMENEIAAAYRQLALLLDFKTLINNSGLEPFPLRILRPVAPAGYVSLGDVIFNHLDPGYTAKLPIIERFGCVPQQCVREMRDWLATDRVYEYSRGGKYLAIYKNPYLQTFRATIAAGVLPPGKVAKVVACVEKCQLVDELLTADKCARKFYNSNKAVVESTNLDNDNVVLSRESEIYQDNIRRREDKITELQAVARQLKVQDDKAEIVNREFNTNKLQNLIGKQQANIAHLGQKLQDQEGQIDINLKFDYAKFMELIYKLPDTVPADVKKKIIDIIDTRAGQKLEALPDDIVNAVLAECPTPETQGLVRKSLVESGCYGCANLQ
jgi:hypothetical protein